MIFLEPRVPAAGGCQGYLKCVLLTDILVLLINGAVPLLPSTESLYHSSPSCRCCRYHLAGVPMEEILPPYSIAGFVPDGGL